MSGHPFTLDTSGEVILPASFVWERHGSPIIRFSDLDPFTQGYVEALLTPNPHAVRDLSWRPSCPQCVESRFTCDAHHKTYPRFADLAPETLATTLRDCAQRQGKHPQILQGYNLRWNGTAERGEGFWKERQAGREPYFPPLTPYLGDDGKVYLKETAS